MAEIKLVIKEFDKYRDGFSIWSVIYIKQGEICFPDDEWWDATSAILEMWMESITLLLLKKEKSVYLNFMDGDYKIYLELIEDNKVKFDCITPTGKKIHDSTANLKLFANQLIDATDLLINHYSKYASSRTFKQLTARKEKLQVFSL